MRLGKLRSVMSMSPTKVDLGGVLAKLDWAAQHIEMFRQTVEAFERRNPAPLGFRAEEQAHPDGSVDWVLHAVIREPLPSELPLIVGDVIHNVRSALDHLVYALSSPKAQRSDRTQFPIFTDAAKFKTRGIPMIESIKGPERTLIENVQPFAATPVPENDPLAILNSLSNLDKHRLPVTTVAATKEEDTWVGTDNADLRFTFIAPGAVQHDDRIVAFMARPQDPSKPMSVHPQSGLQVRISGEGLLINEMAALDVLEMIHHHARHSVIGMWFEYGAMLKTLAQLQS